MLRINRILVLSLVFVLAWQFVTPLTPVRKCSTEAVLPWSVQVDDCIEMPCDLWKGYDSHMLIQFVANRNGMRHLTANVQLTTLGVQIPFELEEGQDDVCKNLLFGAYCPLYLGEDVTYHLVLPIADHHPEVPAKLEVSLLDNKDNSVVSCFVVDTRIRRR